MYKIEQIRELFDDTVVQYLSNKNRGGTSNVKGNTYENFFAVYQLALLSRIIIEYNKEVTFSSQITAFVDDLIIDCKDDSTLRHYQLKNGSSVTWGEGVKSIFDDFKKQYELNHTISRESEINLVVSSTNLRANLEASLPAAIKNYSQVVYFPYETSLVKVIEKEATFRQAIEYLCAFDNPAPDKIECVAAVLLGAWVSSHKSNISVMEILKKAQESTPSFIRSFSKEWQLDPEVEEILSKIPDFQYNLTKGFLHWEFKNGLEDGTLPYSVDTEQFKKFQEVVKRSKPTRFEELEGFLI